MPSGAIFQIQSFLILCTFFYGVTQHRTRKKHLKIMCFGILWDIILILQIELTRGAVGKAVLVFKNSPILNIHVALAISSVLLYVVMIITGRKILIGGHQALLPRHKLMGRLTLFIRTATFITSFFVAK